MPLTSDVLVGYLGLVVVLMDAATKTSQLCWVLVTNHGCLPGPSAD